MASHLESIGWLTTYGPLYGQRYGVDETINDRTTGSRGQEQHRIPQRYREELFPVSPPPILLMGHSSWLIIPS
jgi:hypothetical protein